MLGKLHDKNRKASKKKEVDEDSLIYYSSVNENTEDNEDIENEIDYRKLEDETTIFKQIQNYTKNKQGFDYQYSGTTANAIIISGRILTCANVGDSRCILATFEGTNKINNDKAHSIESEETDHAEWKCIVLSRDHKPECESERKRILSFGGRVEALYDTEKQKQLGPYRVWLKDENVPGLAMSRSLGDEVARKAGVVCDPEIREIELEEQDKFIVQASDGIWEFMSNREVIDIVIPYWKNNDPTGACESLTIEATKRWKESDSKTIDDISVIVVFLSIDKNK